LHVLRANILPRQPSPQIDVYFAQQENFPPTLELMMKVSASAVLLESFPLQLGLMMVRSVSVVLKANFQKKLDLMMRLSALGVMQASIPCCRGRTAMCALNVVWENILKRLQSMTKADASRVVLGSTHRLLALIMKVSALIALRAHILLQLAWIPGTIASLAVPESILLLLVLTVLKSASNVELGNIPSIQGLTVTKSVYFVGQENIQTEQEMPSHTLVKIVHLGHIRSK
jgi:hypothetical protein